MNASQSQATHPQHCYLPNGVRTKSPENIVEVCIATGHTVPSSKQEKESSVSSTFNLQILRGEGRKKVLKIPRISIEEVP